MLYLGSTSSQETGHAGTSEVGHTIIVALRGNPYQGTSEYRVAGQELSAIGFHSGSKTENGIYLAFGATLSLFLMRLFTPSVFSDTTASIATALFWGSILGSLLFYVRLDRLVTWTIRRLIMWKYADSLMQYLLRFEILLTTWRVTVTEACESPDERTKRALYRLTEGPDLHEDIWALKGAFYFLMATPMLFYAAALSSPLIGVALLVELLTLGMIAYNYNDFLMRCSQISLLRTLEEIKSVVQARRKQASAVSYSSISGPVSEEVLEAVLDELNDMIDRRDWGGFSKRIQYLLDDLKQALLSIILSVSGYYIESWAGMFSGYNEEARKLSFIRTKALRNTLRNAASMDLLENQKGVFKTLLGIDEENLKKPEVLFQIVDRIGVIDVCIQTMQHAFYRLVEPPVSDEITELALKWYKQGHNVFAEHLLNAAEYVSNNVRDKVIQALLSHDNSIWRKAGPRVAKSLAERGSSRDQEAMVFALRSGNRSVVYEILSRASAREYDIIKEVVNFSRHEDSGLRLEAVEFFLRVETDLMENRFIPMLLSEDVSIRLSTFELMRSFLKPDVALLDEGILEKRAVYRTFLLKGLSDPNPGVRKLVIPMLANFIVSPEEIAELKFMASNDPDEENRYLAKRALAQPGDLPSSY